MGIENCRTNQNISTQAQYFFNQTQIDNGYNNNNDDMRELAKLEVRIINVSSGSCSVRLILYGDSERKTILPGGGDTETATYNSSTNSISFNKFYTVNYYFEKEQPIDFIISGTINGRIRTTLPNVMGARGQTLIKSIEGGSGASLEIKGFAFKSKQNASLFFGVNLNGSFSEKGIMYTIKYLGNMNKPQNSLLYKSEIINPKLFSDFAKSTIPDIYLAPDADYNANNVEIEFSEPYYNKKLGHYSGALSKLINNETIVNMGPIKTAKISVEVAKRYAFLDYIRGGMQMNLTVAIDFTGSNGNPSSPQSLHYIGTNSNSYEIAIRSCGNIVAYYDYDQLFPAFGFGGKFCGNAVSHCYPLNMNFNNPEIQGIEGIIQAYRNILNQTTLYGPTYFHEVINSVISVVKEDVRAENMNYTILMILTDGIIDDMDETIDALVEASFLPISIIIIGIGNADFSNMNFLDADDEPLRDRSGRKADRDLVQFVPFKKYSYNGEQLAQAVLEEVPKQVIEYYQHKKIPPKEPIFNIP